MKIALTLGDLEKIKEEFKQVTHNSISFSVVLADCLSYWLNNCVVLRNCVGYDMLKAELPSVVRIMEFSEILYPNKANTELLRQLYSLTFYIVVNEVTAFLSNVNLTLDPITYRYSATADEYALYLGMQRRY